MITVSPLAAADSRLLSLTYPRYRAGLSAEAMADPHRHGLVATHDDGAPIGLLLLQRTVPETWRVLSVAVAKPWRQRGVGLALMRAAEDWAGGTGAAELAALFSDNMQGQEAWRALLRRAGWNEPRLCRVSLTGPVTWAAEARGEWRGLFRRLAATGFTVTPWHQRSAADERRLTDLAAEAGELAPVPDPPPEELSVVIREHGEPVGWVLGCSSDRAKEVFYPVGYVVPRLQRLGWLIGGLIEACIRQQEILGADSTCAFMTADDNREMQGFMLRRLNKWTTRLDRHYDCAKALAART
ncbi:MAG: GNAT family N-acetyltransferase [Rhodospirillaceae bacterium]|nr:GNAT family N-acetyltransferase [Rhodospirillales bacterium]